MALPATIAPATPLGSDLKSDGDNQIRALKQFIVDVFGVPANTAINNAAFAITAGGGVTAPQTLTVTGAMTLSSTLAITGAVTLSAGTDHRESTLAHGMTALVDTTTHLTTSFDSANSAGRLRGFGSGVVGLSINGQAPASSGGSRFAGGAVVIEGRKASGTNSIALTGTNNILVLRADTGANGGGRHVFDATGDIHVDGSSTISVFDDYDDVKLLTAARASLMPDCDFKERFTDWIDEYAPVLAQGKIITYNDDGHHFVSYKGMQGLIIDAIRQLGERIECLEQPRRIGRGGSTIRRAWNKVLRRLKPTFALAKPRP